MPILNLTPHSVTVGDVTFPASGITCRLDVEPTHSSYWTDRLGFQVAKHEVTTLSFSSPIDWFQVEAVIVPSEAAFFFHSKDDSEIPHRVAVLTVGESSIDESDSIIAKYLVHNKGY